MNKDEKIKIAYVGCGRISRTHFEAINNLKDESKLIAVCDNVQERAEEAGEKHNVPFFTDYDKMIAEVEADLVVIGTPSGLHPEMGIKAAKAGINVMTEKPMAISTESADRLIEACDENEVRFNSPYQKKQFRRNSRNAKNLL